MILFNSPLWFNTPLNEHSPHSFNIESNYQKDEKIKFKKVKIKDLEKTSKLNLKFMNDEEKVFWQNNLSSYFQNSEEKFYFETCKNCNPKYYEKLSPINRLYITSLLSQKIDFIDNYSKSNLDIQDISNKILNTNPLIKINPFIRKAIIIKSNSSQNKDLYRNISKEFNKINFLDSIRPIYPSDLKNLKQYFLSIQNKIYINNIVEQDKALLVLNPQKNVPKTFKQSINNYKNQSLVIAQILLVTQLSNLKYIDSNDQEHLWQEYITELFSHGGRVTFILPRPNTDTDTDINILNNKILLLNEKNHPHIYEREAGTHYVERPKVSTNLIPKEMSGIKAAIKAYTVKNYKHYGMDTSIGGIMRIGADNEPILNDGTNGHLYIGSHPGDHNYKGIMLIGLESEAPGLSNKCGHVHDARALSSEISAVGGFKNNIIGKKLSGRISDISNIPYDILLDILDKFQKFYINQYNNKDSHIKNSKINSLIDILGNKKLDKSGIENLLTEYIEYEEKEAEKILDYIK